MSANLRINNFDSINIKEVSTLLADAAAATAALTLENNQSITTNDFVIVGVLGSEGSEKAMVLSASGGTSVTLNANLALAHKRGDALTALRGDQIKVYRAVNVSGSCPADAAFTAVGSGTINIDPDQLNTDFQDSTGGSSYWYKFTYKNSTTSDETDLADAVAARGGGYGNYCSVDEIRTEAGFDHNRYVTDATIDSRRIDAEDEINTELSGIYTLPFSPVPPTVARITRLIAAGLLLLTEYGAVSTGTNKEGNDKLKQGRDLLSELKTREKVLVDPTGTSMVLGTASVVTSWPNDTTAGLISDMGPTGDYQHGGDNKFRMNKRF